MSKETHSEKTISGKTLKEKLFIKDDRTIELYVSEGSLPQPVKELEDGDLLFDKQEVLKMLGAKSFEEEFINAESVAKMIEVPVTTVQYFARKGIVPSYRLKNARGSQILYLLSEVEAAMKYSISWQRAFADNFVIREAKNAVFSKLLDRDQSLLTSRETDVLRMILIEDRKPEDIAKKFDLTSLRIKQIFHSGIRRLILKLDKLGERLDSIPVMQEKMQREIDELTSRIEQYEEVKKRNNALSIEIKKLLPMKLTEFDFSVRALNVLRDADIKTVIELVRFDKRDLLRFRNMGKKSLMELEDFVKSKGLTWNMKI